MSQSPCVRYRNANQLRMFFEICCHQLIKFSLYHFTRSSSTLYVWAQLIKHTKLHKYKLNSNDWILPTFWDTNGECIARQIGRYLRRRRTRNILGVCWKCRFFRRWKGISFVALQHKNNSSHCWSTCGSFLNTQKLTWIHLKASWDWLVSLTDASTTSIPLPSFHNFQA